MRVPYWKNPPWHLDHVVWTLSNVVEDLRENGNIDEARLLTALCGRWNPGLNSFFDKAFPTLAGSGQFVHPTTEAAAALPTVPLPDHFYHTRPHRVRGNEAVTVVRIVPEPLEEERQRQVNAMCRVAVDVIHTHAIGTTITPRDIEQGWAQRLPAQRAQKRGISFDDAKHARACATVGIQKMLDFYGVPRERLVAHLVHAVTWVPITRGEAREIAARLQARPPAEIPSHEGSIGQK